MYTIYVKFECLPDMREAFVARMKSEGILEAIRNEKGCLQYDYYFSEKNPSELLLIERWETKEDQQTHIAQPHMESARRFQGEYILGASLVEFELK